MHRKRFICVIVICFLAIQLTGPARAAAEASAPAVRLANILNDNMVLQRDQPVTIWGWARPGAEVKVTITEETQSVATLAAKAPADPPYEFKTKPQLIIPPPAEGEYHATVAYVEHNVKPFETLTATVKADAKGAWEATFPAMAASFKPKTILAQSGGAVDAAKNVLVGLVWLNTGQSNIQIRGWDGDDLETPSARFPAVRFCMIDGSWYQPQDDLEQPAHWLVCSPQTAREINGITYNFATLLHRYLNVPVAVINNARGGTTGQAWCSRKQLDSIEHPALRKQLAEYDAMCKLWESAEYRKNYRATKLREAREIANEAMAKFEAEKQKYNALSPEEKAKYRGGKGPKPPKPKVTKILREGTLTINDGRAGWSPPAGLFNAVVYPLRKLKVDGMVYYQGENNNFGSWSRYEYTFPRVIQSHRDVFNNPEMPIGIVELPIWKNAAAPEVSNNHGYALIRDIHNRAAARFDHCEMIVTNDTGNQGIHPRDKRPVAERCARWALATVYGKEIAYQGPIYREMEIATDKKTGEKFIKLAFDLDPLREKQMAAALAEKPNTQFPGWMTLPCPYRGHPYSGFAVAGEDRIFHPATSVTRNEKEKVLEVRSAFVKEPVAVRYGWGNDPNGNAGNRGLPLLTFRTDDWPLPDSWPKTDEEKEALSAKSKAFGELTEQRLAERKLAEVLMQIPDLEAAYAKRAGDGAALMNSKAKRITEIIEQMRTAERKPRRELLAKLDELTKALEAVAAEVNTNN